ncbi:MAG: hypothetical protein KI785_11895 [Devosiaceae bacterium]|nr:hypothetical protein [Devosiaceae bacterium MH13]
MNRASRSRRTVSFGSLCLFCLALFASPALAQDSQETVFDRISTCAIGAGLTLSTDLEGSIDDIFSGEGAQGQSEIELRASWLELFAEEDRLEAARLYHECVRDLLRQDASSVENRFRYACTANTTDVASLNIAVDVQPPGYIQDADFRNAVNVQNMFGFTDFFVTTDYEIYRLNRNGNYVKESTVARVTDEDRAQFRDAQISRSLAVLLLYQRVEDVGLGRALGLSRSTSDFALYMTDNGTMRLGLKAVGLDGAGQFVAARFYADFARCELF